MDVVDYGIKAEMLFKNNSMSAFFDLLCHSTNYICALLNTLLIIFVHYISGMAMDEGHLELLDAQFDQRHRSYLSAVTAAQLPVLRPRVPQELWRLDERWIPRYAR